MKKSVLFTLLFVAISILSAMAQVKVAYVTLTKTMDATASTVANDPIIRTLSADPNLSVTVKVLATAGDAISDLANYDVIIVQESLSGAAGVLTPTGSLALKSIPKPFIYNKCYALQKSRALTGTTSTGAGKEADGTAAGTLTITVDNSYLSHDLFKGCTFVNTNQIKLFNALSTDAGLLGSGTSVKAINYVSGFTTTPGTLLAQPSILQASTTCNVSINSVPAGTAIDGLETTISPAIFMGMNFGAICATNGTNITADGLTIWRNAVYVLGGLVVPSSQATLPTGLVNTPTSASKVISQQFYTINGRLITTPNSGIYLKKSTYDNGEVKYSKVAFIESLQK